MQRLALLVLFFLMACHDATAPVPPKIHTGGCVLVFKYWMDRADHSKGSLTISVRYDDTDSCPDEVMVTWDDDH